MTRANRLSGINLDGGVFHLTHRCHNRSFLLKFARDRDVYRRLLRDHVKALDLSLLDYCITSNHVHLLVDSADRGQISALMREVASEFARAYNRRKSRSNAFWGDNYHATMVEDGPYLWQCLCYIELNMVRCGVVNHPREWPWTGYGEIMGNRQRYRLLDLDQLCWRLRTESLNEVRANLDAVLMEKIALQSVKREACWTESLAVGSLDFVQKVKPTILSRQETEIVENAANRVWALQEASIPYGQ